MPPRSIASATISFGLVSIPVKVFSTTEPTHEIHFHMIHAGCGKRVHQELVCPEHGVVPRDQIGRGYELAKGQAIELDADELEALDAVASSEIAIREMVPASAVDPIYVDRTYYLAPDRGGSRAYRLLHDAFETTRLVGIAAYAARGKSYIVMVRPFETGLAMHQLRYADEVKPWAAVELGELPPPRSSELQLAATLIRQLERAALDLTQYTDEVKERVRGLLAEKARHGQTITMPAAPERGPVVTDLMAALRDSLAARDGEATADTKRSKREPATVRPHRARQVTRAPAKLHAPRRRAARP